MLYALAAGCCILLLSKFVISKLQPALPPGPKGSFWSGNLNQLPWVEPWKVFTTWTKTYGPLIYLYAYGRNIVIAHGYGPAVDLMDKRALLYARRPKWSMAALTGRSQNIAFMDHNERQRKARALMQSALNPRAQREWGPVLEAETTKLIQNLLASPENYKRHVKWYLASFINKFTFGFDIDDTHQRMADELSAHTQQALRPGRWAVDVIPFLIYLPEWLPGMGFKRWAREAKAKFNNFVEVPFQAIKRSVMSGADDRSMVANMLREIMQGESKFDEPALISAASSIYTAATDTTAAILFNFLLLITTHPEVQKKAYAELLEVVGTDRLPGLADQASLPYINAVMKEVHRFNPVTPMIPRSPVHDDNYREHRIPQDTWVMFNIWSIAHDPTLYSDPEAFRPERHLPSSKGEPEMDPREFTFGFGKRVCPGSALANVQIYIVISTILAVFDVRPPLDAQGQEEMPPLSFTSTFVSFPKPFSCRFVPRNNGLSQQLALMI